MACEDESVECRQARADYFGANSDFLNAQSDVNVHSTNQMVSLGGAAIGFGVALASPATGPAAPFIAGLGILLGGFSTGVFLAATVALDRARGRCRNALSRLLDAHSRASLGCRDPDCVPPLPQDGCG